MLPSSEVAHGPEIICTSDYVWQLATYVFLNFYSAYESSESTIPPEVAEDLGLLEMTDQPNFNLEKLVEMASSNERLRTEMQKLNSKLI